MADKQENVEAGGRKKPKKSSPFVKYMIIIVGASFLLSSFSYDLNKSQDDGSASGDPTDSWNLIRYDGGSLGTQAAVVRITGATDDYKLRPTRMDLVGQDDMSIVFESNVTGVVGLALETGAGDDMFDIRTDGGPNVSAELRKRIRLPGGYSLYRVYKAATDYGELKVIGENIAVGDWAKVHLMERRRAGATDVLGYVERRVDAGPEVDATVLGFDSVAFGAVSGRNITRGDLAPATNSSDIEVAYEAGNGTEGVWTVSFTMPADTDPAPVEAALAALNLTNVTSARFGYVRTPEEIVLDGNAVSIPNGGIVQARLGTGAKANATVRVSVYLVAVGNQTAAFAIEASGNGTAAR
jgi:hypothetical protein